MICEKCGLPKEICACAALVEEVKRITVNVERKKFGKEITVIEGLNTNVDLEAIAKKLKSKFACGGTVKDGRIELQGDHRKRIKEVLGNLGFSQELIDVK